MLAYNPYDDPDNDTWATYTPVERIKLSNPCRFWFGKSRSRLRLLPPMRLPSEPLVAADEAPAICFAVKMAARLLCGANVRLTARDARLISDLQKAQWALNGIERTMSKR
jgi:hypothetical protein